MLRACANPNSPRVKQRGPKSRSSGWGGGGGSLVSPYLLPPSLMKRLDLRRAGDAPGSWPARMGLAGATGVTR